MKWEDITKWGFAFGLVGAFIIFGLNQWLTVRRARKQFSFKITSDSLFIAQDYETSHRLSIFLDDKPIKDAGILRIIFANTGSVDIDEKDFAEPISVYFFDPVEIIEARIVTAFPERFQPSIDVSSNEIIVKPTLMNHGDKFMIKAIITPLSEPKIRGRIKGITDLRDVSHFDRRIPKKLIWLPYLSFSIFTISAYFYLQRTNMFLGTLFGLISVSLIVFDMVRAHWLNNRPELEGGEHMADIIAFSEEKL